MPRLGRRFFFFGPFRSKGSGTDSLKQEVPKNIHTKWGKWIWWRLGVMIPLSRLGCFFSLFFCTTDAPMIFGITLSEGRVALITRWCFFRLGNLSQQNLDRFNDKDSNKKSFTNASIPMKKTKDGAFGWGVERLGLKIGRLWTNFLGIFFYDSRSESSRNLEFRGCFRRSRYALSFGGLVMGFFAKDLFSSWIVMFFFGAFRILARHPSWNQGFAAQRLGFLGSPINHVVSWTNWAV